MDKWLLVLLVIGGIILFISILYTIIAYKSTVKTIFKTVPATASATDDIIAYYYLPAPLIKITATAKVEIVTDAATNQITSATLKELNISAVAEIFPDTSQLLLVNYTHSGFANDDIKIGVNAMGLLENVASVTEDRFTNVINALLEAPGNVLKTTPAAVANLDATPELIKEIKEYTKEFILKPDKIRIGGGDDFAWIIDLPDAASLQKQIDASFNVSFYSPFTTTPVSNKYNTIAAGNGIYVRPTVALQIYFSPGPNNPLQTINANAATITVPDVTKAILLSVTRAMFVKKTQGIKLQNGMLLENAIVKSSEAEAFVSIPVNILKAIFSIPAQLLSFRINHVQQQKTLVTDDSALAKAKLDSEKAKLGTEAELAKAKLESQKDLQEAQKNVFNEQTNVLKAWQVLLEEMKKKLPGNT